MAVGHRLPNGYIVLLLTPREGTLLRDQLLEPEGYPWLNTESQMVGMEVRSILTDAVTQDSLMRLQEASNELTHMAELQQKKKKQQEQQERWQCNHCAVINTAEYSDCQGCGRPREELAST